MNYILEELEKIGDPQERRREAVRLLEIFDHPQRGEVPEGWYHPAGWDAVGIAGVQKETDLFYQTLESYLLPDLPAHFVRLRDAYVRRRDAVRRLAALSPEERRELPGIELPPFAGEAAYRLARQAQGAPFDLEQLVIDPKPWGKGGFAEVYRASSAEGEFALKLFYCEDKISYFQQNMGWRSKVMRIVDNVRAHDDVFSQEPFTKVRFAPDAGWYLMDFFDGRNVSEMLDGDDPALAGRDTQGRLLFAYASMLSALHARGMVFNDNNWGSVLLGDGVRICDFDLARDVDGVDGLFADVHTPESTCREKMLSLPYTYTADLEGFAHMVDHLVNGEPIVQSFDGYYAYKRAAAEGKRRYTRGRRIPKRLRGLVRSLLSDPRDESLTAEDFVEAVRLDF